MSMPEMINTPLHVAALSGEGDVAMTLIGEFDCIYNVVYLGQSLLHKACQGGSTSFDRRLMLEQNADIKC